jgi:hypothetical protein
VGANADIDVELPRLVQGAHREHLDVVKPRPISSCLDVAVAPLVGPVVERSASPRVRNGTLNVFQDQLTVGPPRG